MHVMYNIYTYSAGSVDDMWKMGSEELLCMSICGGGRYDVGR